MKNRFVTAAVETDDVAAAYDRWRVIHSGNIDDFITYITKPSCGRDHFVAYSNRSHEWSEDTLLTMI